MIVRRRRSRALRLVRELKELRGGARQQPSGSRHLRGHRRGGARAAEVAVATTTGRGGADGARASRGDGGDEPDPAAPLARSESREQGASTGTRGPSAVGGLKHKAGPLRRRAARRLLLAEAALGTSGLGPSAVPLDTLEHDGTAAVSVVKLRRPPRGAQGVRPRPRRQGHRDAADARPAAGRRRRSRNSAAASAPVLGYPDARHDRTRMSRGWTPPRSASFRGSGGALPAGWRPPYRPWKLLSWTLA